ncbi:MAG: xanthine dehydrogenase family protein, partial [Spirochaetales bacterium]
MENTEDLRKILQGKSLFVGDILDPKAYWVKVKRSSIPCGRVKGFIFPSLPSNVNVIRQRDIPGKSTFSLGGAEVPILTENLIRYLGEPILLLVGPSLEELNALSEQIVVLYEEEKPVFDFPETEAPDRVAFEKIVQRGKAEESLEKAHIILERTYITGIQDPYPSEPHGAFVRWQNDETTLDIYTRSRWPYHVHKVVQEALSLPWELISVSLPLETDTSVDCKLWYPSLISAQAALAAWICRKPIKYLPSREEDFCFSPKRPSSSIHLKAAVDKEGRLIALYGEVQFNVGAYPVLAEELIDRALYALSSQYAVPNLYLKGKAIVTNLPPVETFPGFGDSQSQFALEVFVDELGQMLDISPVALKERNLSPKSLDAPLKLLKVLKSNSDFERKHAAYELIRKRQRDPSKWEDSEPLMGLGIAIAKQGSGLFIEREQKTMVEIKITQDRKAQLLTSSITGSPLLKRTWREMVASALELPLENISVEPVCTRYSPDSGPSFFSRSLVLTTKLIEQCCNRLKKKKNLSTPHREVQSFNPKYLRSWNRTTFLGNPFLALSWAAAAVEVDVDPLTLTPKIKNIWIVIDAGKILHETEAKRIVESGIAQSLGWALKERLGYLEGSIPKSFFRDFRIFTT